MANTEVSDTSTSTSTNTPTDTGADTRTDTCTKTWSRSTWREHLREKRRGLSASHKQECAQRVADHLMEDSLWRHEHIGLYLGNDGELDPAPIASAAQRAGKHIYLPVITPSGMAFSEWRREEPLRENRYGIGEPQGDPIAADRLQLLLLPTVGWTTGGFRLGMGGGYYDRFLAQEPRCKAQRFGLAYECQGADALECLQESWDQILDGVLTEAGLKRFMHPA